jgi:hypothetical protein
MNKLFLLLIGATLVAITMQSCLTKAERFLKRQEKAKQRIEDILKKYPDLKTITVTEITTRDTVIQNDTFIYNDTLVTKQEIVDSTFYYKLDSVYKVQEGNIEALFEFAENNKFKFKVIKKPEYIYVHDTLYHRDTIVNTNTIIKEREVVNTTKNFWFNLWLAVKGWIWWILIIVAIIVILRLIFKFLK